MNARSLWHPIVVGMVVVAALVLLILTISSYFSVDHVLSLDGQISAARSLLDQTKSEDQAVKRVRWSLSKIAEDLETARHSMVDIDRIDSLDARLLAMFPNAVAYMVWYKLPDSSGQKPTPKVCHVELLDCSLSFDPTENLNAVAPGACLTRFYTQRGELDVSNAQQWGDYSIETATFYQPTQDSILEDDSTLYATVWVSSPLKVALWYWLNLAFIGTVLILMWLNSRDIMPKQTQYQYTNLALVALAINYGLLVVPPALMQLTDVKTWVYLHLWVQAIRPLIPDVPLLLAAAWCFWIADTKVPRTRFRGVHLFLILLPMHLFLASFDVAYFIPKLWSSDSLLVVDQPGLWDDWWVRTFPVQLWSTLGVLGLGISVSRAFRMRVEPRGAEGNFDWAGSRLVGLVVLVCFFSWAVFQIFYRWYSMSMEQFFTTILGLKALSLMWLPVLNYTDSLRYQHYQRLAAIRDAHRRLVEVLGRESRSYWVLEHGLAYMPLAFDGAGPPNRVAGEERIPIEQIIPYKWDRDWLVNIVLAQYWDAPKAKSLYNMELTIYDRELKKNILAQVDLVRHYDIDARYLLVARPLFLAFLEPMLRDFSLHDYSRTLDNCRRALVVWLNDHTHVSGIEPLKTVATEISLVQERLNTAVGLVGEHRKEAPVCNIADVLKELGYPNTLRYQGVRLNWPKTVPDLWVRARKEELAKIILGLFANVADKITQQHPIISAMIQVDYHPNDRRRIHLRVTDTGPDVFSPSQLEEFCENSKGLPLQEFVQVGGTSEGRQGFGLPVSYVLARLWGGKLWVSNQAGPDCPATPTVTVEMWLLKGELNDDAKRAD